MLNRRQFFTTVAASAVTLAQTPRIFAASYDMIIRGGRVIDPSLRLNAIADIGISDGRIVELGPDIVGDATEIINAQGKLVVPGLLDVHTHYARDTAGPDICLADGVTGWVDSGSRGANDIEKSVAIAQAAPQVGRVLVNIGRAGILPEGDTMDIQLADVAAATSAIAQHRDVVVGVKARLSQNVCADDYEVLRRTQEVASSFDLPVMIHMGQTASPLARLLALLKPGDIVTHMFAPPPNGIVDENGIMLPDVLAARRRGIWFDVANGRTGHLRWDIVEQVLQAGFWPDTFSTDGNSTSRDTAGVIDFPNIMSKFLSFGMTLDDVVARATINASRLFPFFNDLGTLNIGSRADIALLELREDTYEFLDNYGNLRPGRERLFPSGTILGGIVAPQI